MASSTNQLLKPVTTKRNLAGNIEIGGCDAVELVQKYDTPLYVIDEATLRSICKDYKKAFENIQNSYDVCFKSSLYKCYFKNFR